MTVEAPSDGLPPTRSGVATLKALLAQTQAALAASEAALAERTAAPARVEEARRRLELIVDELRRARFGAKSSGPSLRGQVFGAKSSGPSRRSATPSSTPCRSRTSNSPRGCSTPPRRGPTRPWKGRA